MNSIEANKLFETELAKMLETKELPGTWWVSYPVYVPSKGRADKKITTKFLEEAGVPFYVVVEPQDAETYKQNYDAEKILVMEKNDQGIAYARNFCKEHSQSIGAKYHWQIDDNIHNLGYRAENKNRKGSAVAVLGLAEAFVDKFENVGGASLSHTMFAFAKNTALDVNKQVYSCALFCNSNTLKWRPDVIEDTDYSLQLLSAGYTTILFNRLIMNKMATGVLKGGNTEISHGGNRRLLRSQKLQEYWPGWFKITEQYGRVKVAPSRVWKTFKQELLLPGEVKHDLFSITHG
jgi:hypothetical protein